MTADDGASLAQSKTHEKVRQDIADSSNSELEKKPSNLQK
jgi:hypothetical protein